MRAPPKSVRKPAVAASKVEATLDEAALTTKIKAKMALDDAVKARSIDVTTRGSDGDVEWNRGVKG